MRTAEHQQHIERRVTLNTCAECSADRERRFVSAKPFQYGFVSEYLSYITPRLAAFKADRSNMDARHWYRRFMDALQRRTNSHNARMGRKYADSYLERMGMMRHVHDEYYLRQFANRGASCLDA